jgi:hypothetical protein
MLLFETIRREWPDATFVTTTRSSMADASSFLKSLHSTRCPQPMDCVNSHGAEDQAPLRAASASLSYQRQIVFFAIC